VFLSGRGQGHVSNFFIVDLENFATSSRRYTGDIHNSIRGRFVYDTYKTMEATRSRHGGLDMFITHWVFQFAQDLSYKYFMHCCVAIGKISTDTTHRAVPRR